MIIFENNLMNKLINMIMTNLKNKNTPRVNDDLLLADNFGEIESEPNNEAISLKRHDRSCPCASCYRRRYLSATQGY